MNTNIKHGFARRGQKTKEYHIWRGIIARCENPNNKNFHQYGGRGISICKEWRNDFTKFLKDVGKKPTPKHTIDRVDSNGNYEPNNCKWSTWKEQQNNKRSNKMLTLNGKSLTVSQWAEQLGVKQGTLYMRVHRGWSDEKILTQKIG